MGNVQLGFALACHDREALAHVDAPRDLTGPDIRRSMQGVIAARCGVGRRPDMPIPWLSDNGSIHPALNTRCTAERLHLVPITTPAASPQSNGMSEALVNTLRRDYLADADLSTGGRGAGPGPRLACRLQCRGTALGARLSLTPPVPDRGGHDESEVLVQTASRNGDRTG